MGGHTSRNPVAVANLVSGNHQCCVDHNPWFLAHIVGRALALVSLIAISDMAVGAIGTTSGSFSVSATGSAEYSIPITVPPGTAGMAPELKLIYSSRNKNGLLGVGWQMSGLSQISRCAANLAQDELTDPVDLDANDRLCLDGKRLVPVSGEYGQSGTEYRTEIETYAKVQQTGPLNGANTSFRVWTKSGLLMDMGATDGAMQVPGRGEIQVWAVDRISDTAGNYIDIEYRQATDTQEHYVQRIDYTGNTRSGTSPYNSVRFVYEADRPDPQTRYLHGGKITTTRRLTKLQTYAGNANLVREYRLVYETGNSGRSRISSVRECTAGDCLPTTTFEYQEKQAGYEQAPELATPGYLIEKGQLQAAFADVFGHGVPDWIGTDEYTTGNHVRLNRGKGWLSEYPFSVIMAGMPTDPRASFIQDGKRQGEFKDLDGNGRPDYAYAVQGHRYASYLNNSGDSFAIKPAYRLPNALFDSEGNRVGRLIDLNGNGLPDYVDAQNGSVYLNATSKATFGCELEGDSACWEPSSSYALPNPGSLGTGAVLTDINGDGRPDFIIAKASATQYPNQPPPQIATYINTGSSWQRTPSFDLPTPLFDAQGNRVSQLLDLNGDGLNDLVCATGDNFSGVDCAHIPGFPTGMGGTDSTCGTYFQNQQILTAYCASFLNTGNGWARSDEHRLDRHIFTPRDARGRRGNFYDFNGDGRPDLLLNNDVYLYAAFSDCDSKACRWQRAADYDPPFQVATHRYTNGPVIDLNGDGFVDVARSRAGLERTTWLNKSGKADLLTNIENGLGAEIQITYAPLTEEGVYSRGDEGSYPIATFTSPMRVVSKTRVQNGNGSFSETSYRYTEAQANIRGRGFLGFASKIATEATTGMRETTMFAQEFPYTGMRSRMITRDSAGNIMGKTEYALESKVLGSSDAKRYYPYASRKVNERYELSPHHRIVKTQIVEKKYDDYGNAIEIVETTGKGEDASTQSFTKRTINTFTNDVSAWQLGRLKEAEVTSTTADGDSRTQGSTFAYNQATGLLTRETSEPGSKKSLTKQYEHDLFGNRTSKTVSGPSIKSRTTTTKYDSRGQFPRLVTNPMGHSVAYEYSSAHGQRTQKTGPNGLVTKWRYDGFGRKSRVLHPDGTFTDTDYLDDCGPWPCSSIGAAFTVRTTSSDGRESYKLFNLRERETASAEQAFLAYRYRFKFSEYDDKGRKVRVSQPVIGTGSAPISDAYTNAYWTRYRYDLRDRPIEINAPINESTPSGAITSVNYRGLVIQRTDTNGNSTIRESNARGDVIRVTDAAGNTSVFTYGPFGSLTSATDEAGNTVTINYDIHGNRTGMSDPDMGDWTYNHDALGQLRSQTDAKDQTVTYEYDKLGRKLQRTEPAGVTTWSYDNEFIGKLDEAVSPDAERQMDYDHLGRLVDTFHSRNARTFTVSRTYDSQSRLKQLTYPSGFAIERHYHSTGHLDEVRNASTDELYWRADIQDAYGNYSSVSLGNGLGSQRYHDPATGYLHTATTGSIIGQIQNQQFDWDAIGNLELRVNHVTGVSEEFHYDSLYRLEESELNGAVNLSVTYDAIGNIKSKSRVGTYSYGDRPHAVTEINGVRAASYEYDANGNMLSGAGRTLEWTSFNKPSRIIGTGNRSIFTYGPEHQRVKQVSFQGLKRKATYYVGKLYEQRRSGLLGILSVEDVHYIHAGGRAIAAHTTKSVGANTTHYLHRNHQGSVVSVSDSSGALVESMSYGAFGKRRTPDGTTDPGDRQLTEESHASNRGYTGHEHLDHIKLIHMNGRIYDPIIGRFTSADPSVQFPYSTQGLNRYTYVANNPLSFTDPTGFSLTDLFEDILDNPIISFFVNPFLPQVAYAGQHPRQAALIGINLIPGAQILGVSGYAAYGVTAGQGFAGGMIASGGDLEAGLVSAATASAFYGVGEAFGHGVPASLDARIGKVIAHGTVGGVSQELMGGEFKAGFYSAGFAQAAGHFGLVGAIGGDSRQGRILAAAVIGGTASELGGGKFANGAVTAAFARTYNEEAKYATSKLSSEFSQREAKLGDIRIGGGIALEYSFGIRGLYEFQLSADFISGNMSLIDGSRQASQALGIAAGLGKEKLGLGFARSGPDHLSMGSMVPIGQFNNFSGYFSDDYILEFSSSGIFTFDASFNFSEASRRIDDYLE